MTRKNIVRAWFVLLAAGLLSLAPVAAQKRPLVPVPQRVISTNPAPACCGIASIDAKTGIVTAKENATGRIFAFKVNNAALLQSLKVGQGVYANFSAHQVSVDGRTACCAMVSLAPAATPPARRPAAATGGTAANAAHPNPATPCCGIASIDVKTAIVTAKENATGRIFTFKVTNAALLRTLKIGQAIYANFGRRQVSVDGMTSCCPITGVGSAPTAGGMALHSEQTTQQPSPAGGSDKTKKPGQDKKTTAGKDTLGTEGTVIQPAPEPTTAMAIRGATAAPQPGGNDTSRSPSSPLAGATRNPAPQTPPKPTIPVFTRERLQIRMVSQGKRWRLQTFTGMVGGRRVQAEALYHLIGKEGISESPIPQQVKNELLRDAAHSSGNDIVYIVHKSAAERIASILAAKGSTPPSNSANPTGSSDNGCHDAFGWGNHVNRTASISFGMPGDLVMLDLNDQDLGPVNASGKLRIKAPMSGHLSGEIGMSVLDFACQPVAFKFRFLHLNGSMDVAPSLDLDAQLGVTHEFKKRLAKVDLGGFSFFIGPIPVYVGFDAFLEGRLRVTLPNLVQVKYSAQGNGHGALDASCNMNGCSATPSVSFTWTTSGDVTFLAQGVRAVVRPGVLGGIEAYLYDPTFVNAHAGIEPYVKGDFWAYSGSCKGTGTAVSHDSTKALTADVDGGYDVLAGIDASGLDPNGFLSSQVLDQEFTLYNWEKHLKFYDLIGSTALTPVVEPNPPAYVSQSKTVAVHMRPCYPYAKDKDGNPVVMTYQVGWGDASPDSTSQAAVGSAANPAHTWNAAGQFMIHGRALKDSHGREFPAQTTQATIDVKPGNPGAKVLGVGGRKPH